MPNMPSELLPCMQDSSESQSLSLKLQILKFQRNATSLDLVLEFGFWNLEFESWNLVLASCGFGHRRRLRIVCFQ
jgi:hypothetical protein